MIPFLVLFCLSYLVTPADSQAKEKYIIKFATVAPEGSTWVNFMRQLDQTLRQKSNGQIEFKIYAGGIFGDEMDVLRKIRIGQVHCAAFSGVGITQILPEARVLDLPFLFKNTEEVDLVHKKLLDYFSKGFKSKGFTLLSWAEVGDVHLFSKKPINRVDDLKGLKIWTWSGDPISKETFSVMGSNPIPLSITDVTMALNRNMIDTVYAPPLGALALQWNVYVKYMTAMPMAHATGAVLIVNKVYDKLPPDLRELLNNEFKKAMSDLTLELRKQSEQAINEIQKQGVTVIPEPVGQDLEAFHKVHQQVAANLSNKLFPEELLQHIYKILNQSRATP
jgi:TRAP-type C4-dicarboxylate transport system substrate-binding protein